MHPRPPRLAEALDVDVDAQLGETPFRAPAELVVAERGEEFAAARKARDLSRDHGAAACRLEEQALALDDLARRRQRRHAHQLDPLDVSDDGASHGRPPFHV